MDLFLLQHLLRESKLEALEIHDVNSKKQVDGLHKILSQSVKTLVSLRFENCQIPSKLFSKICDSLLAEDRRTHKIKHFRVNSSRSFEAGLPTRVVSFLSSARSLCTVDFCDSNLSRDSAKKVFNELSEASSDIAVLDLSENDITGWLPFLMWKKYSTDELCTLKSLRVLRLRSCNLQLIDAARLNYELFKLTNLKTLNLSDNPIKDDGLEENDGGMGAAEFISKLLLSAPGLIKLDASYNALPAEATAMIGSSVKSANGKLRYLDLSGNSLCGGAASREMLKKSVEDKHIEIYWPA
nr:PREDICTED: ribonuclease inhibitor-like [Daucus carota subsp. sativus]